MDFLIQQATEPNLAEETLMQQRQMELTIPEWFWSITPSGKTSRQVAAGLTFIPLLPKE